MAIEINLERIMFERKMSNVDLAKDIGLTPAMMSRIKLGKVKGIRFSTLDLICKALNCEPQDILFITEDE